jgi:DNA-binding transcriptional LysR family regulator
VDPTVKLFYVIDVRRLLLLRELDNRGTVAATAAALHLTPSAVSQQLATLAKEAGVPLLDQVGRRVRLTAAAKVLLRHADEIFTQLERAEADLAAFAEGQSAPVMMAGFPTAIMGLAAPAVRELRTTHPGLEITILEVQPPDCHDNLLVGELDLALDFAGVRPPDPRFEQVRLLDDPFEVALPADHPRAGDEVVALADLADEVFLTPHDTTYCGQIVTASCAAAGFTPRLQHRTDDFLAMFALIAAGCGVGLIPRLSGLCSTDEVVLRPLTEPPLRRLAVTMRSGAGSAPHLRAVIGALRNAARVAADAPPRIPAVRGVTLPAAGSLPLEVAVS